MRNRKTNQTPPPGEEQLNNQELPGNDPELLEDDSLLSFILDIDSKYPNKEDRQCRIYRNGRPKVFVDKLDYIPEEFELKEQYGGGAYNLMFFAHDGKRMQLVKSFSVTIEGKPKLAGEESAPGAASQPVNSEMEMLQKMKLYKELFASDNNNGGGTDLKAIVDLINESNKNNQALILEMIKSSGKNDSSDMTGKLLDVLIKSKQSDINPLEQIKEILEIKDLLGSKDNGGGGDFWSDIIKSVAPALMTMAMKNGAQEEAQQPPQPVYTQQPPQPQQRPSLTIEDVRRISKLTAQETINEEFPIEDEPIAATDTEIRAQEPQDVQTDDPNSELANNQEGTEGKEVNGNMQGVINQLKTAPEFVKISALKTYLKQFTPEQVKAFVLDNGILRDEAEFNEYLKKAGYEPVEVVKQS